MDIKKIVSIGVEIKELGTVEKKKIGFRSHQAEKVIHSALSGVKVKTV